MTKTEEKKSLEEQLNMIIEAKNNKTELVLNTGLILLKMRSITPKAKTKGGVYLPDKTPTEAKKDIEFYYEEHPFQGVIIMIGPPKSNVSSLVIGNKEEDFKKGDYVYITKMAYDRMNIITFEQENYLTVQDNGYEILCKIPSEYIAKRIDKLDLELIK